MAQLESQPYDVMINKVRGAADLVSVSYKMYIYVSSGPYLEKITIGVDVIQMIGSI